MTFGMPARWTGENEFTGAVSSGLHVSAIYSQNVDGVQALKAYFFAPGTIVCLGAGITSDSPYPVETTVEQRQLVGDFVERAGGIWHGGVAYLGNGMLAKVVKAPSLQVEATNMLTIGIPHGTGCRDRHYAVEIRPCVERERFTGLKPLGHVVSNTTDLQAVEFADGTVCAVFHKAGRLGDFETDTPCVYILENDRMYLADPTHLAKTMKFSFRGQSYMLTFPDGLKAGSTVTIGIAQP
jgi:chondroitin AC lyase